MKQRSLIKSEILQAWSDSVWSDYCNQRINSERSLQASFWGHLNDQLSKNRRLFIEPGMSIHTKASVKKLIPDIVVCNSKEVIAVIELKYLPRAQPRYKKDINTLSLIAQNKKGISISNERFRGKEKDSNCYTLASNVLFVWAGIHAEERDEPEMLYSTGHAALDDCFLELHAVTRKDRQPEVYQRF